MYVFVKDPLSNTYVKAQLPAASDDEALTADIAQYFAPAAVVTVEPSSVEPVPSATPPASAAVRPIDNRIAAAISGWFKR
jgi:hypothetical protein